MGDFKHTPVMLGECIDGLDIKSGGIYVDGTAGGGGHSFEIAKKLGDTGRLICIDRDAEAIRAAGIRLGSFGNITLVKENFVNINHVLDNLGIKAIDGVLLDLGVSSYQLDEPSRGFSFLRDAPLDMRMDRDTSLTAFDVINEYNEKTLAGIFYKYGEEKFSGRIARQITARRLLNPIETTLELADIVSSAIPRSAWEKNKHPATRVFQAVRLEVNNELGILESAITRITERLATGGRLCIITFHSLEDRIVKTTMKNLENPCFCPRDFPICVCGKHPLIKLVTRKPLTASESELSGNIRSRSAKLRIGEKLLPQISVTKD